MKESAHIALDNIAEKEEIKGENTLIKKTRSLYSNKTPFHTTDLIDPIFGPQIKNEAPRNEFYTTFLSICNIEEKMVFMRKVYFIYFLQILLPLITSLLAYYHPIYFFIVNNHWIIWLNIVITTITAIPLLLFPKLSKIDGLNITILFTLSVSVSVLLMVITIYTGLTFTLFLGSNVICCICLLIATYLINKEEYVCFQLISLVSSIILIYFIIIALIIDIELNILSYSILFSSIYLIFIFSDTYIILEVKSYKYSINDYILVSMTLYTDVIMIIFFLLSKMCDGKLEKKQN